MVLEKLFFFVHLCNKRIPSGLWARDRLPCFKLFLPHMTRSPNRDMEGNKKGLFLFKKFSICFILLSKQGFFWILWFHYLDQLISEPDCSIWLFILNISVLLWRLDCLAKTIKMEGYFGMYRGMVLILFLSSADFGLYSQH